MKKRNKKVYLWIIRVLSFFVLVLNIGITTISPVNAFSTNVIVIDNIEELDQFVNVTNNQYELTLPESVLIHNDLKNVVTDRIDQINKLIIDNDYYINPETKIAKPRIITRIYGVNSISMSWNSIIIKMDAGLVQLLLSAAAAGGIAGAVTAFPALVAWIVANPIAGVVTVAVVASIIDSVIGLNVKSGVVIHYNFFLLKVTVARLQ